MISSRWSFWTDSRGTSLDRVGLFFICLFPPWVSLPPGFHEVRFLTGGQTLTLALSNVFQVLTSLDPSLTPSTSRGNSSESSPKSRSTESRPRFVGPFRSFPSFLPSVVPLDVWRVLPVVSFFLFGGRETDAHLVYDGPMMFSPSTTSPITLQIMAEYYTRKPSNNANKDTRDNTEDDEGGKLIDH